MKIIFTTYILLALFIYSCSPNNETPVSIHITTGVFIVNEGTYTWQNASVSLYQKVSRSVTEDIFYAVNLQKLGDVGQSMILYGEKAFIVVNNSGKIHVVNSQDAKLNFTLNGFTSPRYVLPVNDSIIWVSDLYEKFIWVVNTSLKQITDSIVIGKSSEQMIIHQNKVYVANWSGLGMPGIRNNTVMIIDKNSQTITDSLNVGIEPNSLVLDSDNRLWVLCSGGFNEPELPSLYCFQLPGCTLLKKIIFPNKQFLPTHLLLNSGADTLTYIWHNVYSMSKDAENLPVHPIINSDGKLFYGLGIDPQNSDIYVSDAMDYVQKGWVFHYDTKGEPVDSFRAGIAPGFFCFK